MTIKYAAVVVVSLLAAQRHEASVLPDVNMIQATTARGQKATASSKSSATLMGRSSRVLQGSCISPTDVFDDDAPAFLATANPVCYCNDDTSTTLDFSDYFQENPFPDNTVSLVEIEQWIDDLNEYVRNLVGVEERGCQNQCSVCASSSTCVMVESTLKSTYRAEFAELITISDIVEVIGEIETIQALVREKLLVFSVENTDTTCYTPVEEPTDVLCFTASSLSSFNEGLPFEEVDDAARGDAALSCMAAVGSFDCASCAVDESTGCIQLDCTNIPGVADSLDSCNPATSAGVLGLLYDTLQGNSVNYTLGSCDDMALPPVAVPVSALSPAPAVMLGQTSPPTSPAPALVALTAAPANSADSVPGAATETPVRNPTMTPSVAETPPIMVSNDTPSGAGAAGQTVIFASCNIIFAGVMLFM